MVANGMYNYHETKDARAKLQPEDMGLHISTCQAGKDPYIGGSNGNEKRLRQVLHGDKKGSRIGNPTRCR